MSEDGAVISVNIEKNKSFSVDSPKIAVQPNEKYKLVTKVKGIKGVPYSGYFCVILFDAKNRERGRRIRWITDFSGNPKEYAVVFVAPADVEAITIGYRLNGETVVKSVISLEASQPALLKPIVTNDVEGFDDTRDYVAPRLRVLTEQEEIMLEKKMVWLFGAPRSGTTWLGARLLKHPQTVIWNEPWIGFHIGATLTREDVEKHQPIIERNYDVRRKSDQYFFCDQHRNNWLPALRKFIIARAFSQAQMLAKNIIIKEPAGAYAADIVLECLPNSKLIFLLRDGRDVVDSRLDNEMKDWSKLSSDIIAQKRYQTIQFYSVMWNVLIEHILNGYNKHDPKLRMLVKYEDLKRDTFAELKKIYEFIGIKIEDPLLRSKVEYNDFKNIPSSEKGPGKFNRAATTGAWKNTFSQKEQELMNSIMGPLLTQLGYKA